MVSRRLHSIMQKLSLSVLPVIPVQTAALQNSGSNPERVLTTPGAGSFIQVSLSLIFVLGLVFGLAWLLRRVRTMHRPGRSGIEVLAEVALGPKERAVLLQFEEVRLLVGVAPGQVRTLQRLPDVPAGTPADTDSRLQSTDAARRGPPTFAELLRRSLGR